MPDERVAVDPTGHDIAHVCIVTVFGREFLRGVIDNSGDGRGPVAVSANIWRETESIVRLAETRVISATQ